MKIANYLIIALDISLAIN